MFRAGKNTQAGKKFQLIGNDLMSLISHNAF